jgi:2-amino-4-hydroxy-6-hydroxymethyldihydropteridine diphosphokinase
VTEGTQVYVSVGSNLGDKVTHCRNGIDALLRDGACRLAAQSPFYRTEPVGYADQDWFVNAVVNLITDLTPEALLRRLLEIETEAGRVRKIGLRYGPRVLDLDMILYGDRVINLPDLVVPHPRMHKRRFVLQPMCDINATLRHPVMGCTMARLLKRLDPNDQRVLPMPCAF